MTGHRALRDFAVVDLGTWAALEEKAAHRTFLKGAVRGERRWDCELHEVRGLTNPDAETPQVMTSDPRI